MGADSWRERRKRWQVGEVLERHPGLRLAPLTGGHLVLAGELAFHLQGPSGPPIEDAFQIEITVQQKFPLVLPSVRELPPRRIPPGFHQFEGGNFCLASPTRLRLAFRCVPTLPTLVEDFVVPYLFGYAYHSQLGEMPFGELDHGCAGLRQDFAALLDAPEGAVKGFLRLAAMKKRVANKLPCPCGSGRRLGNCHNRRVNRLRKKLGRNWFARHLQLGRDRSRRAAVPAPLGRRSS